MAKTNKSYRKRLKITRSGKILRRIPGKNHFNSKATGQKELRDKGWQSFNITKKDLKRFLPTAKI